MGRKKCKDPIKKQNPTVKDEHLYECKKCGIGAKKEGKLCKPKKLDK